MGHTFVSAEIHAGGMKHVSIMNWHDWTDVSLRKTKSFCGSSSRVKRLWLGSSYDFSSEEAFVELKSPLFQVPLWAEGNRTRRRTFHNPKAAFGELYWPPASTGHRIATTEKDISFVYWLLRLKFKRSPVTFRPDSCPPDTGRIRIRRGEVFLGICSFLR